MAAAKHSKEEVPEEKGAVSSSNTGSRGKGRFEDAIALQIGPLGGPKLGDCSFERNDRLRCRNFEWNSSLTLSEGGVTPYYMNPEKRGKGGRV